MVVANENTIRTGNGVERLVVGLVGNDDHVAQILLYDVRKNKRQMSESDVDSWR